MMPGVWMVVRGTDQPAGECTQRLKKPLNAVKMDQCGEVILCNTPNTMRPLTEHQPSTICSGTIYRSMNTPQMLDNQYESSF